MRTHVHNDPPYDELLAQDLFGLVGEVVAGRFRILDLYHSGPRSLVYEAEPPGVGKSRRALKVINLPEGREPEAVERLERYVERLRSLNHPHLERVFEVGRLADQTPFLLAEWLPLGTLSDSLAHGGRLPTSRSVQVIRAVCQALDALHSVELSHGDVRPGHVLTRPSRAGFARIILVGAGVTARLEAPLARRVNEAETYQAPELVMGHRPTMASDVYSLGGLAYLLLAGRPPFTVDDPRADEAGRDPLARLRWLHLNAHALRPAHYVSKPDFSEALEEVVGKALSRNPADRFTNARAFSDAFEAALAQVPEQGDASEPSVLFRFFATPAPVRGEMISRPAGSVAPEQTPAPVISAAQLTVELAAPSAPIPPRIPTWVFAASGALVGVLAAVLLS